MAPRGDAGELGNGSPQAQSASVDEDLPAFSTTPSCTAPGFGGAPRTLNAEQFIGLLDSLATMTAAPPSSLASMATTHRPSPIAWAGTE